MKRQPGLEEIAKHVRLSPHHLQRMFTAWAGVSPKKFLQYLSLAHAKKMLKEDRATILKASVNTGLSGTGRLHDLFMSIEGMTPGAYQHGGEHLQLNYNFSTSPFGKILIASTVKGVSYIAFVADEKSALKRLQETFPRAVFKKQSDLMQQRALSLFARDWDELPKIKLHLKGTEFQLKVWEALLTIPMGHLSTYGSIAARIHRPKAVRAVGTAVGDNPVAFLIPCHRVIQSSGIFGNYHWGSERKLAMIGWEAARSADEETG